MRRTIIILGFLATGACASQQPDDFFPEPEATAPETPAATSSVGTPGPVRVAPAWLHGVMNLRSGPGMNFPITVELPAGTEIRIGVPDSQGWAQVYDLTQFSQGAATSRGWIYTRSTRLRASPPAPPARR